MATAQLAKLTPPRLGRVYLRTRLFDQLTAARQSHPVIWIGAPAGAGKTTLAASYLSNQSIKPLWYSVDEGDADPASFFYYFGLAAKQACIRKTLRLFTAEYQQGLPVFTRNFFRDLFARLKKPAVLVLDNYQDSGENTVLHTILQHAIEEIPPEICIIVLSRAQPPQELARLRTHNVIEELNWDDLRLDEAENHALIATMLDNRPLNAGQVPAIFERTQGWVTGVVLTLKHNMLGGEDTSDLVDPDRLNNLEALFDYFATQVLAETDDATREFLYAVSFLPTMTASQCVELTHNPAARTILQRLERNNFFTTRRGILNVIYEFHPLFRQFLQVQADDHFTKDRKTGLQVQAATLSLRAGEEESAVDLLIRSRQWELLIEVIKQRGQKLVRQGRYLLLREWTGALPTALREQDAWMTYWHGAALLPDDPFAAYELFSRSYPEFRERDDSLGMYLSWIGAAESLFFRHDEMQPVKYWIAALEHLRSRHPRYPSLEIRGKCALLVLQILLVAYPNYPGLTHWLDTAQKIFRLVPVKEIRCITAFSLGWYYATYCDTAKLTLLVEEIRPLLQSTSVAPFARLQAITTVLLQAWVTGDRNAAYQAIETGLELAESSGIYFPLRVLYSQASMVYLAYGDEIRAELMIERFRDVIDPRGKLGVSNHYWQCGWLAVIRHNFSLAKTYLQQAYDLLKFIHIPWLELLATGGLTQVCTELEEFEAASDYLHKTRQLADQMQFPIAKSYYCNCLEAYWRDKQGDTALALIALQKAYGAAHKQHMVAYNLWEKDMMTRLCVLALQHDVEPQYARRVIAVYRFTPPEHSIPIERWPYPLKIHTLGRFSLLVYEKTQDLSGKSAARPIDLLKCLIALGGRNVSQDRLIQALWSEAEIAAGIKAFHTTLYRLRKLIALDDAIVLKNGMLSLDSRHTWVDVWTLERILTQLDQATRKTDTEADVECLSLQMLNYYKGPFLAQDRDQNWMVTYREKLYSRMLRTLSRVGHFWQSHEQNDRAIAAYEHVLELNRLYEPAYQHLMQLYLQQGRYAEAAATYERCRKTISSALGVMPSDETLEVYKSISLAG
jgi:LuxR family maltose regulon positive regulatory protein